MSRSLPRCGSCKTFVQWVITTEGRRVALDLGASAQHGTVWILDDGRARFLSNEQRARARETEHASQLRVPHRCSRPEPDEAQTTLDLFGAAS